MTARQQSLAAKAPRYAAFYFTEDDTTGIAPVTIINSGETQIGSEVTCTWNGEEVRASIIDISNSRACLTEALEDFKPPSKDDGTDNAAEAMPHVKPVTNCLKKVTKPKMTAGQTKSLKAQTLASGPACSSSTPSLQPIYYNIDEEVQSIIDGCTSQTRTQSSQTSAPVTINNYTQTVSSELTTHQLLSCILERIDKFEEKINARLSDLEIRCASLQKSNFSCGNSDPYDFEEELPSTPVAKRRRISASTPSTPSAQPVCEVKDLGFWKLTPSELLGKPTEAVISLANRKTPTSRPVLDAELVEQIKHDSLNQRTAFAKNLVMAFFTLEELYNHNVHGRVSHGVPKKQLDTEKVDIVKREVFKFFPCLPSEEKKMWAECVRAIDKANVYLFSVVRRKFDISEIMDYL